MSTNTLRYEAEEPPPRPAPMTYWRRRFLALVIGLAVLALIAWAFSGVLDASAGSPAAGAGTGPRGPGAHSAAAASGTSGLGGPSGSGAAPPTSAPTPSGVPSPTGPAPGSLSPAAALNGGPASSGPLRACGPGDVVLTLFSGRDSYAYGQQPAFEVDVVSTSAGACAFNVGPGFLALVVTAGRSRIWGSADCVAGGGSRLTDLARGVPVIVPLTWDRQTSAPGCAMRPRRVRAGSFTATASDGSLASNPVTFTLKG